VASYSATAIDHFQHPRNVGALDDATAVGTAADDDNLVIISLRMSDGRIVAARFRALACNACIACASIATVLLQGRRLEQARELTGDRLVEALDGLPAEKLACATLVATAIQKALDAAAVRL
jgi:nitrogen fixation NifU-like protein